MRLTVFLCFMLVSIGLFSYINCQCIDRFEPGCKTLSEVGQVYRNCIDPTKYWKCNQINTKATLHSCPTNTAFDEAKHACIPWIGWVWTICMEPPSRPPGWVPC